MDYIDLHRQTYDTLADEYFERLSKIDSNSRLVGHHLAKFVVAMLRRAEKSNYRILELGCGPGAILAALKDETKYDLFTIDLSPKMLAYAKQNCPRVFPINRNVLDIDNLADEYGIKEKFDLIIMASFIHLFPIEDAALLINKLKEWLEPNGLIYVDTTDQPQFMDGRIMIKEGCRSEVKRLRTYWTNEKFNTFLYEQKFEIIKQELHTDNNGKTWIRTIIQNKIKGDVENG
jgi:SAM-dependent methyltransferase